MLPSGWSPLELVKHLTYVEMRWLEWGFEGRPVDDPWGDQRDGRWHVGPEETLDGLLAELDRRAGRPRRSPTGTSWPRPAYRGSGGTAPSRPPWSAACCTWCRSTPGTCGHLDVVRELLDGRSGRVLRSAARAEIEMGLVDTSRD